MARSEIQSRPEIILIGAGGHASACIDVIEQDGRYAIAGMLGLPDEVGKALLGYQVLGADSELAVFAKRYLNAVIAIGQIKSPELRIRIFGALKQSGCELPTIVSPRAYISPHAKLSEGTIVMHGAIVNAGAVVGRNCIVNSRALIEHDVEVGDHCHIATGASLNGGVVVGARCFVGSSSVVRESVKIGEGCVIGMGQVVNRDCPSGTTLRAGVKLA